MRSVEIEVTEKTEFARVDVPDCTGRFSLDAATIPTGRPPVAGSVPVEVTTEELTGLWSLRFGMFGCTESETRGGVIHISDGLLAGGDSTFAYLGHWTLTGIELLATLDVARHRWNEVATSVFGIREDVYHANLIAHAITADLFEGRIRRLGYPDARLTMRRIAVRRSQSTMKSGRWRVTAAIRTRTSNLPKGDRQSDVSSS